MYIQTPSGLSVTQESELGFPNGPLCASLWDAQRNLIYCHRAAVKLMKTRIRLLPQPKSMRSTIATTQREQQHGLA
jgi:hypothetical protein